MSRQRVYYERGAPVVILTWWGPGGGPRNVAIERADGTRTVRPFRGLRKNPPAARAAAARVSDTGFPADERGDDMALTPDPAGLDPVAEAESNTDTEPVPTADPRELRRRELDRRTKAQLIRLAAPHVMGARPLTAWRKDEIVTALLDREFRPQTEGTNAR